MALTASTPGAGSDKRQAAFDEILSLTHAMLHEAEKREWELVADLEQRRQHLMADFFSIAPASEEGPWLAEGIRTILDVDKRVMEMGRKGLDELGAELDNVQSGQRAQRVYGELERLGVR